MSLLLTCDCFHMYMCLVWLSRHSYSLDLNSMCLHYPTINVIMSLPLLISFSLHITMGLGARMMDRNLHVE
jgi:succinate dehydrogenase hydrophobic anchor subunit